MKLTLGVVHKLRLQDGLAFFDHIPPFVYILYGMKVYKKSIFLTTYPPPLVNVVCERFLVLISHHKLAFFFFKTSSLVCKPSSFRWRPASENDRIIISSTLNLSTLSKFKIME